MSATELMEWMNTSGQQLGGPAVQEAAHLAAKKQCQQHCRLPSPH